MAGLNYFIVITLIAYFDYCLADYCINYTYGHAYCSGYCYGNYRLYEFCSYYYYEYSLSYGAIIGIVIGCVIFLGVFITCIVAICSGCTKRSGQTGRLVHPGQGVSMVSYSHGQQHQMAYHPPLQDAFLYQSPSYNAPSQPPPNYSALQPPTTNQGVNTKSDPTQQSNQSNLVLSAAPINHFGHDYR